MKNRHRNHTEPFHPVGCQKSAWAMNCGNALCRVQPYGIMISCVLAPALSDLRATLRLAGPAEPVISFQGRRAARAAARGRRAAPRQPPAPARLGRPRGPQSADPAPASAAENAPPGHPGHRAAMAPASGHPPLDLPQTAQDGRRSAPRSSS